MHRETRIYGDSPALPAIFDKYFRLHFGTENLELRWTHCSATANFLTAYFRPLIEAVYTPAQTNDLAHSIAYLANELLENAVKFRGPGDVVVEAGYHAGDFVLRIGNCIEPGTSDKFQSLLAELTAGDPGELLLERIEANAADEGSGGSGLGILTLMHDYGVRFCWTFAPAPSHDGLVHLETVALLSLPDPTS